MESDKQCSPGNIPEIEPVDSTYLVEDAQKTSNGNTLPTTLPSIIQQIGSSTKSWNFHTINQFDIESFDQLIT
eukprot:UN23673